MNERLKQLREALNLNQREFSSKVDLSQPALAMFEKGNRIMKDIHISRICSEFNVNEKWLREGIGEMFIQSETFSLDEKAKKHNLSPLEIDIMKGYMELPQGTRNELLALFGSIYSKHSEIAATVDPIEEELENYRRELEAEKKIQMSSSVSPARSEPS